jgi:hypothetical protein
MHVRCLALLAPVLLPVAAFAQSSFIAPDGLNRYPGVTVWCPNGAGVVACNFGGGGGGGGAVSINLGGTAVSASHPFTVSDGALEALISAGALKVGGSVTIGGTPAVAQSGAWQVSLAAGLPAGANAIGSVGVSNFPATQAVSGSVAVTSLPALPAGANSIGTVGLAAGSVGSVTAAGTGGAVAQAVQGIGGGVPVSVSGPVTQSGSWSVGVSSLPALPAGSNAIGGVSVSNFPATQAVSAASLPLPAGAAMDATVSATAGPLAPGTATATKSLLVGCEAQTTLPGFSAGQQGAVPCDTSGRLYVVTVPSANNVPGYLQAVSAGGATTFSAANAAASCMATNIKSSSGMVYGYSVSNSNAAAVWLRLFASGSAPTCGSGTPGKRILVPAGGTVALSTDLGWVFSGGVGFDVTSGSGADTDTATVATANSVLVNIDYK